MTMMDKRKKTLAVGVAVAVLGGGVAYAYWTTSGGGSGSAATAEASQAVTVVQTSTVTDLRPGAAAQPLSGNFDNPNTGPAYVGTVTASIASVTKPAPVTGLPSPSSAATRRTTPWPTRS
jgi:hypothetical protein